VNLVQPGYFKSKTVLLGDYFGIFKNEMLVAVTGERMKMNHFTEASAIVTHPDHTGKGYAKQLIAYAVNKIADENKIAYLHVAETNTGAIALYLKLGFVTRRKISFWNFVK
jgi:predicted GNAT family acetyltransferase